MKKNILPIAVLALTIIVGSAYVSHLRSQVKYVDMPCPACGSNEVLDFGTNHEGNQCAHCYDCSLEFTIENE